MKHKMFKYSLLLIAIYEFVSTFLIIREIVQGEAANILVITQALVILIIILFALINLIKKWNNK